MQHWRRNFIVIWLSQFLSFTGFAFAMPFVPYYLQDLGVKDPTSLKIWVALFAAATPLTMAIFSPLWGSLSDRYGRRVMLLRANIGGMAVLGLMGVAPNPSFLIFMRLMQGVFSGNIAAAQALAISQTPSNKSGMVLGSLNAALFSGQMVGAFFGGGFAEFFGYRLSFVAAAAVMAVAAFLTLFGTTEEFTPPSRAVLRERRLKRFSSGSIGIALPILFLIMLMVVVRQFYQPWMSLLVQELHGGVEGASLRTGTLSMISGIAGAIAGPVLGRLADRVPPPAIGKLAALGAGITIAFMALARTFTGLILPQFGTTFASGGLDPVFQIWLTKITPADQRGFVFGWSATARSVGFLSAPMISGFVAAKFSLRAVFWCAGIFYILLIPIINIIVRRIMQNYVAVQGKPAA